MSALVAQPQWSEHEYLEFERTSEEKHDFVDGRIVAMAGNNRRHDAIVSRLTGVLDRALESGPCEPFTSEMKIHIPATGRYRYPDASIACEPAFLDENEDVLKNPCVIFEVLSKSTEAEDRGDKFKDYRSISSFQEYVLIGQQTVLVEHYTRQPNGTWNLELLPAGETLRLSCAPLEISVQDLYKRVVPRPC